MLVTSPNENKQQTAANSQLLLTKSIQIYGKKAKT